MQNRENDQPVWLQQIDHTGDAGFDIQAETESQLFVRAAWAMFDFLCDIDNVQPADSDLIVLEAADREALMVKWLSELNYLHITEEKLFREFEIGELTDTRIQATVRGERVNADRHKIYTEIKAVTYHGLKIEKSEEGFQARVIFDL